MIKKITCIECPKGCTLSIDIENCKVNSVTGAKCPRGTAYGIAEMESPSRIFTATVFAEGLELRLVPVRTNKPIPKKDLMKAVETIRNIKILKPLKLGDVIDGNFLGQGVKLLATRSVNYKTTS